MKRHSRLFRRGLALITLTLALIFPMTSFTGQTTASSQGEAKPRTGPELYLWACANCHGSNGKGVSQSLVGFDLPIRDFTECRSTAREPDSDWTAVALHGGPARGFSELMPAFEGLLSLEEIRLVVAHLRTFCPDSNWPRGELNFPRPLVTEKAFPEDEAVLTTAIDAEGTGLITSKIVYEQRVGARNQFEIVVPFGWQKTSAEAGKSDWSSILGDLAVGVKRAFYHSSQRGSIFSAGAELVMPTGDEARGFGKGTFVLEPFISFGQLLRADFFLHLQTGVELPFQSQKAEKEGFFRLVLGRSFDTGRWNRSWSPMIELVGARELVGGAKFDWDIIPQLQVTLNKRKNIMANLGLRLPLNNTLGRNTQVVFYLLWDWFDGTIFEGW